MEIRIGSYIEASFLLEREPNDWHALVILDSDKIATDFLETHTRSHRLLRFDDIEQPQSNRQPPSRDQVQQGLNFARGKDKLLVSCRAGQGRSVAMAFVIACEANGIAQAVKLLNPTRHRPNRLVVSLGESLLEISGVLDQFDNWRQRHRHVRLADYYDEMEREFEALEAQGAVNKICRG